MPLKRLKDGKVIKKHATKQPTAKQAEAAKKKRIADQLEQREEFESAREKTAKSAQEKAPAKPSAEKSVSTDKSAASE